MKRLGIFVFYDKYGTVNEYVKYLLKQMSALLSECCIVCNGCIIEESREWIKNFSNYTFFRENNGFDAGAYQDVILNGLGLSKLREFDELVLFNNSFYGPIYSFEDMFQIMENRKVDFWGITAFKNRQFPYHIQSYFMVIENKLLHSDTFEEYWRNQKKCETFHDAVENFELKITAFFTERGFTNSVYIDYEKSKEEYGIEEANILNAAGYELLVEKHCPIIKRKHIMQPLDIMLMQSNENMLDYIDNNTSYSSNLIWEDLIKEYSPYELYSHQNLFNYLAVSGGETSDSIQLSDVCIVIDSVYLEQFIDYLDKILFKGMIVICTDEKLANRENALVMKKKGQTLCNLLFEINNLKKGIQYFCIIKDSNIDREKIKEKRNNHNLCKNMICSNDYILKVKSLFEHQPYLGALFTEETFDDNFLVKGFYKRYLSKEQAELLNKTGCHATAGEQLINHSGCFWVRKGILDVMEEKNIMNMDDFENFPYFVKSAGFYSGMLYNIEILAKEHARKNMLLNELMENVVFFDEPHIERQILEENILKFVLFFQDIYIYGAGKYAKRLIPFLERKGIAIKGVIVTSKKSGSDFMGYSLKQIDEVKLGEKTGIIVAMSQRNQKAVKEKLRVYPEENIYYV